ncbi:uncharacterized protein EV420DRAFT_1639049 [Desarmillaria tabescens]|uniref:Uncharacterized protein n=1 Tax=Armillaria tabescens TaxID=1929756 RepID=A0AA39TL49_ARMTA|nr:uncharacterized protein EV420DRAFT_1639049 [Desarmillaria tabescens]KAK0462957.1 hypothetical protein EV420DRAFT_1639049 [Desarmillaria tabescens]
MLRFLQHNTDGNMDSLKSNLASNETSSLGEWKYLKKPGFQPRPLRLAICGAGAAGLCLAYKVLEAQKKGVLGPVRFVLFEKDDDYTGTWHANRYPGCRCDVPSAAYQFSFAPYADWPEFYSYAGDIKKYFKTFSQKFGIVPHIRLRHKVTAAIYDAVSGTWEITVRNLETSEMRTETYDLFAPATGVLSNVNRPAIPGLESFTKAPVLHTAEWPVDFDWKSAFKDEHVAVIGVGSSGLQTVGTIAPVCKSLDVYARTKLWIIPLIIAVDSLRGRDWRNENFTYSEEERAAFVEKPEILYDHLKEISASVNSLYDFMRTDSEGQKELKRITFEHMKSCLGRDDLLQKLVPSDHGIGCRRPTPGAAFLEALKLPSVDLINDPIKKVTPTGIVTEGGIERPVDRLILATGFDTTFKPGYELRGKDGVDLRDVWAQRPRAYFSTAVAGFPNMFLMGCGPGITYANGSLLPCIEAQADYVVACLSKLQKQDLKAMEVVQNAQDEYNIQRESLMKDLIWTDPCASWYKGGKPDGEPDALYAGSTLQFMEALASPRWEDWNFVPLYQNRFSFLGNGESSIEAAGGDRAYYITMEDAKNVLKASDYAVD